MSTRRRSAQRINEMNERAQHENRTSKQLNKNTLLRTSANPRKQRESVEHHQHQELSAIPNTSNTTTIANINTYSSSSSESTFKFLITTDNHLGFAERDPRRGDDSFTTFEELLRAARIEHDVDAILLGGDLFHENKPSLGCMARTCSLLRKYVMGDKDISFQLLSDPAVNFPTHPVPLANFQDPNINVALPIFIIHGNHDDPVGGTSALDILAVNGYVNYFGHTASLEDIVLQPILLQKGHTYIALYGLGNVRDERLHRCFELNKVHFMYPKPISHRRWFNILILHQNRNIRGGHSKAGIPEHMLAGFGMDLVIWGNEHEQRITPEPANGFDIIQPGSTVMTAFSAQECNPKQYGVLEIRETKYRLTPFTLRSVRPAIRRVVELWRENPHGRTLDAVEEFLRSVMEDMITEAEEQISHIPDDVLTFHPHLKYPLMRLAVDFNDLDGVSFPQPNLTRFGQQYMDVIANPAELLRPVKRKPNRHAHLTGNETIITTAAAEQGYNNGNNGNRVQFGQEPSNYDSLSDFVFPVAPQLNTMDIRSKVAEVFQCNARDACTLLSEPEVSTAVYAFAEKGERDAIDERIAELLDLTQRAVWRKLSNGGNAAILKNDVIVAAVGQHKLEMNRRYARANLTGETLRVEEKASNSNFNSTTTTTTTTITVVDTHNSTNANTTLSVQDEKTAESDKSSYKDDHSENSLTQKLISLEEEQQQQQQEEEHQRRQQKHLSLKECNSELLLEPESSEEHYTTLQENINTRERSSTKQINLHHRLDTTAAQVNNDHIKGDDNNCINAAHKYTDTLVHDIALDCDECDGHLTELQSAPHKNKRSYYEEKEQEEDKGEYEELEELEPLPEDGLRRVRVDELAARVDDGEDDNPNLNHLHHNNLQLANTHAHTRKRWRSNTESTIEDILATITDHDNEFTRSKELQLDVYNKDGFVYNNNDDNNDDVNVNKVNNCDNDNSRNKEQKYSLLNTELTQNGSNRIRANTSNDKRTTTNMSSTRSRKKAKDNSVTSAKGNSEKTNTNVIPTLALSSYHHHHDHDNNNNINIEGSSEKNQSVK